MYATVIMTVLIKFGLRYLQLVIGKMFNPLLEDLTQLKDSEIEAKINDLSTKFRQSARFSSIGITNQLAVVYEAYKAEQSRRQQEALKRAFSTSNKSIEGLIKKV